MSMKFFDAFPYLTVAQAMTLWSGKMNISLAGGPFSDNAGVYSLGTTFGRFPGQVGVSLRSDRGDGAGAFFVNLSGNFTTLFTAGAWFFPTGYPGGFTGQGFPLMVFADGATDQISFLIDAAGHVVICKGVSTTPLVTGTYVVSNNNWHRFEFKVTVDGVTGLAECYVDSILAATFTGNTKASANSYTNRVYFCSGATLFATYMVDPIVYDNAGAAPTGYLGDKRFYVNFPSASGTVSQYTANTSAWPSATVVPLGTTIKDSNNNLQRVTSISGTGTTGGSAPSWNATIGGTTTDNAGANQVVWTNLGPVVNYQLVNETSPDDDYCYLSDATVNDEEGFKFDNLPAGVTGIIGVGGMIRSRKDDAGTRSLRIEAKSGASIVDNGSDLAQLSNYAYYEGFFATDPQTSAAWTKSGVDNAELRAKTIA